MTMGEWRHAMSERKRSAERARRGAQKHLAGGNLSLEMRGDYQPALPYRMLGLLLTFCKALVLFPVWAVLALFSPEPPWRTPSTPDTPPPIPNGLSPFGGSFAFDTLWAGGPGTP